MTLEQMGFLVALLTLIATFVLGTAALIVSALALVTSVVTNLG